LIFGFLIAVQKDSYKSTGCFDLTCSGFVQIATEFALGSIVGPYSAKFNQQYELHVGIFWVIITCLIDYSHISIQLFYSIYHIPCLYMLVL